MQIVKSAEFEIVAQNVKNIDFGSFLVMTVMTIISLVTSRLRYLPIWSWYKGTYNCFHDKLKQPFYLLQVILDSGNAIASAKTGFDERSISQDGSNSQVRM